MCNSTLTPSMRSTTMLAYHYTAPASPASSSYFIPWLLHGLAVLLLLAVGAGMVLLALVPTLFLIFVLALPALLPLLVVALSVVASRELAEKARPDQPC